jgi:hypothetical protein
MAPRLRTAATAALAAAIALTAAPAHGKSFEVTYKGSGTYRTVFHGEPPNGEGERDDTNDAHDSSRQTWAIKFRRTIDLPACGQPADDGPDPCASLTGLRGARGPTSVTGRVNHKHVDGIFRALNRTVRCRLRSSASSRRTLPVSLGLRYLPDSGSIGVTGRNPVATALTGLPAQCAGQGDSIDRIADFYATPGFSFADGYGPDRWFTSREVAVPVDEFNRSRKIEIPLGDTPAGTPPRRCAVRDPSFERCKTGGSWRGVLTFTASPAAETAHAARARVVAPRSGHYGGTAGNSRRKIDLYTSGRTIDLAAFDFKCDGVVGRTSLNDVPLKKGKDGWKFAIRAHGSVTFSDEQPDENAAIGMSGTFSRTGKAVKGRLRVKSPRCGNTGDVAWSAKRKAR